MKEMIEAYLTGTREATSRVIAEAIGLPALDVSRELSRLTGLGTVEREKRLDTNEYWYWLAGSGIRSLPPSPAASGTATPLADTAAPLALRLAITPAPEPNREPLELQDLLGFLGVPEDSTDKLRDGIRAVGRLIDDNSEALALTRQTRELIASQQRRIDKLKANNAQLEANIDELTIVDAAIPSLFVTFGKAMQAKRHTTLASAQRRASALVRSEKESEVLVLVPIGRMLRGAEWRAR